ncbi:MAG: secretin N-terminal domain-containing protein [Planctomycetota bacterium]
MRFGLELAAVALCASATLALQPAAVQVNDRLPLAQLLQLAADRNGIQLELDPALLSNQTVQLQIADGFTDAELWDLATALVESRGFTTVPRAGGAVVSLVRQQQAQQSPITLGADGAASWTSAAIEFADLDLDRAAEVATDFIGSSSGRVTPLPELSTLILTGTRSSVDQARAMLTRLEAAVADLEPFTVELEHLSAPELSRLIGSVNEGTTGLGVRTPQIELVQLAAESRVLVLTRPADVERVRVLIERLDDSMPKERRTYQASYFSASELEPLVSELLTEGDGDAESRIFVDELTDSLIVTATPARHTEVQALFDRLDALPRDARRSTRVITLRNRAAAEIRGVLESLIQTGILDEAPEGEAPPTQAGEPADQPDRIQITADDTTNRLILTGSPRDLDQIESLLIDLDVRRPQVMIEVLIYSLSDGDSFDLGIELTRLLDGTDTLVRLTSLFGLSSVALENTSTAGLGGSGGTAVILDPGEFSAVVNAIQTLSQGQTLSFPKVLVDDNESATINSVAEEPFLSVNASDTVATTTAGGSESAGTQVTVTPQIAEGDHLVLQYDVSLSAFTGDAADPSLPPPRQTTSLSSRATIPDGYTVALGGIEVVTNAEGESRVPILGQIPILGNLFKTQSETRSRARFFVFIRANVMRDNGFESLKYLSDVEAERFGIDDGWPQVEPRIIR